MKKKIDPVAEAAKTLGQLTSDAEDELIRKILGKSTAKDYAGMGEIKEPIYFKIPLLVIEKHCGEGCDIGGLLLRVRWFKLFRIGTKTTKIDYSMPVGGYVNGGWYHGRQYWNGTLSDPGTVHPLSTELRDVKGDLYGVKFASKRNFNTAKIKPLK